MATRLDAAGDAMELDQARLRRVFLAESEEGLASMEELLVALEHAADASERVAAIFRVVHTLKGNAAALGLERLAEYVHQIEDVLVLLRDGRAVVSAAQVTLLLQCVDSLRGMLRSVELGRELKLRETDRALVARLVALVHGDCLESEPLVEAATPGPADVGAARARRTLRVDMEKLDAMLDLTGEITVARSRLMQVLRTGGARRDVEACAEELERLLVEMQEQVMQLRLVPLGPVFRQQQRVVRDVAAAQSKIAQLRIEGGEVEVDASVVEHLRDPLTHMVRNATDHGIERPAVRRARDKPLCGTVTIRARHERGTVVVEVADDGAGIDRDRVAARARERGLLADGDGGGDLLRLLTLPGFSTAEQVTEVSGRGVGLDVVRRNVEALRGELSLESRPGAGTAMRARLPLTLAIIQGFAVSVAGERYVLPLDAVAECLRMPSDATRDGRGGGVLDVRGEALPFVRLRDWLALGGTPPTQQHVVVVRDGAGAAGLVVDALHGETQAVLKPLGRLFQRAPGVAGSTILGDGRVALILDVSAILHDVSRRAAASAGAPLPSPVLA